MLIVERDYDNIQKALKSSLSNLPKVMAPMKEKVEDQL